MGREIRNPRSLIDKLGVKPEHCVIVLGVKDPQFLADLAARAASIATRVAGRADIVFLAAETLPALARLTRLRASIQPHGMIWTVTPKGRGGLKDTDVIAAGRAAGLVDVKVASFSATHTATKFVIPKAKR
jgi:hypothetical protein